MLYEIVCDKFKKNKIVFHQGLNTVLGTEIGDNSIGKSTFLLIVDFVFGGTTYTEASDIIKNVGEHEICFTFIFDDKPFYFSRSTINHRNVWICDKGFSKIEVLSLDKFCNWLDEKYDAKIPYLSFRNFVGRYIRVYGKGNANERLPLHSVPNEKMHDASYALLKLFELYLPVRHLSVQAADSEDELKAYQKAQKLNFIDNIGKRDYIKNEKAIEQLNKEIDNLTENMEKGIATLDAELSDEAIRIKKLLSNARRMKSKIKLRLDSITNDEDYKFSATTDDFDGLREFFPDANIQKLELVEEFHKNISKVFRAELSVEKKLLSSELIDYDNIISTYENQLSELIGNPNISKTILRRHSELIREIDKLRLANDRYDEVVRLKNNKNNDVEKLIKVEREQFAILQNAINSEMQKLNDYIYNGTCNSPIISFTDNNYSFFTPDDTGTGVAYKGLVVFDLAVLNLTKLPVLVHDSIVLKQISDTAVEKILESYINSGKQVIIALDKQNSYTEKANKLLKEKMVLALAPNGHELFGRSWG